VSRWRRALGNALLAACSLILCLIALEGLARLERRGRQGGKEQRERLTYIEHDPLLGWRKIPGAEASYRRREFSTDIRINSHGLRDPERDYRAAPGTLRVVALGDSFLEAYQVPLEDSVTQRLERSLSDGCSAEVINGGTAGYGSAQEYLFFKQEGVRYAPRVVLLFFYYNDILYTVRPHRLGIPKPLLVFDSPEPRVANYPVPWRESRESAPRPAPTFRGSAAFAWLADRLEQGRPQLYNRLAEYGLWPPIRRRRIAEEFLVFRRAPDPGSRPAFRVSAQETEAAWDRTERILEALNVAVRGVGAQLLAVYVPARMEIRDADWKYSLIRFGLNEARWDRDRVRRQLTEIGDRHGFAVLDLVPALRQQQGLLGGPYFEHDSHWNSLGHQVAAEEIDRRLRQLGWVAGC
jgi:lysophospholipase L1-like esterase